MPRLHSQSSPLAGQHHQHQHQHQHHQHHQHQQHQNQNQNQNRHPHMADQKLEGKKVKQSPISRLPPELLFRILTFVGLTGGPSSLWSCNLSCKGFHEIIEDPALDKYIYRAAAFSLLSHDARLFPQPTLSGTRVPPTATTTARSAKQTFKALARTLHLARRSFPSSLHHTSTTSLPPKGQNCPTTRHGPNPATRDWSFNDDFRTLTLHGNEKPATGALPLLSVDPQGRPVRRIIDFVHSSTEASRTGEGVAYVGVKTCGWSDALPPGKTSPRQGETANWILFSDDPRVFPEKRDRGWVTVQRAAIVGGTPSTASSTMPVEQRLRQLHLEKAEAAGKKKKVELPHGTPPPPTARDIAEAEKVLSPFIKPVDHDKFLNAQRWGDVTRGLNASTYKALPNIKSSQQQQQEEVDGQWFTVDKAMWTMTNVCDSGLVGFGKSLLHSDANLRLIPRLVQRQLEVAQVERLSMKSADGDVEVNMVWKMPHTIKELSLELIPADDEDEQDWDEEVSEVNWEFKSCGEYLVVCDDNSGSRGSTISCFSGHTPTTQDTRYTSTAEPLRWQRRMVVKRLDGTGEYWLDNDGISLNSSVVAYSTRRHIYPGTNRQNRHKAVMEFHILSLRTGDTIKVLNLAEEERLIAPRCWMWCSFALGDGTLIASLGGLGAVTRREEDDGGFWAGAGRRKRYGYENLFVWDLGDEPTAPETAQVGLFRGETEAELRSLLVGPRGRIPVPQGWGEVDKYVVLSGCGRFLGACAEWKMAVWDLEQKTFDGVWRVGDADSLEVDSVGLHVRDEFNRRDDECVPWNGLWVKWRDVIDDPSASQPEVVKQALTYVNSGDLRRAIGGVDLEMDRRRRWMMERRLASVGHDNDMLDDSDSDSDSVGSAWMGWGDGPTADAQLDGEDRNEAEGDSDVDPSYMGYPSYMGWA